MSQVIGNAPPYNAPYFFAQAIPGLIADSTMVKNVDSWACDVTNIQFGVVCSRSAAASMKVVPGGTLPVGISVHDHLIASRGGYTQYDAVSVLSRGRIWAKCDATLTGIVDGAPLYFVPATGAVSATATGNTAIPKAVFRSAPASIFDMLGGAAVNVAVVEFNYPTI
jgi:hypothetical protein